MTAGMVLSPVLVLLARGVLGGWNLPDGGNEQRGQVRGVVTFLEERYEVGRVLCFPVAGVPSPDGPDQLGQVISREGEQLVSHRFLACGQWFGHVLSPVL
jgi:hypothetical protein